MTEENSWNITNIYMRKRVQLAFTRNEPRDATDSELVCQLSWHGGTVQYNICDLHAVHTVNIRRKHGVQLQCCNR